jgi:hypothetical protein
MGRTHYGPTPHTPDELMTILDPPIKEVEDIIRNKGLAEAIFAIDEYMNDQKYPFVQGEERDKKYIAKLRRIKERYFDPI